MPPELPPPPPIDENPQLRLFLDRASAVVAQCGGLNAKSRILLGQLADELGLTRDEAEPVIRTLLVATEDFSPTRGNGRGYDRQPRPQPPPLPTGATNEAETSASGPPPVVVIDDNAVLQNFTDQAAYLVAQHGGWSAKTRAVVSQLAKSMGVTPREMETALAALQDAARAVEVISSPPPAPPALGEGPPGVVPPVLPPSVNPPPPVKPKPEELYRAYLHRALDDLRRPRINPRREQRLIEQGTGKLGLSSAFARQLLCEVARERQVTIETQACPSGSESARDERIAEFLRRARAIIAEQRGVTVAGQIKISAAACEIGLSEEESQRAMALLQEGAAPRTQEDLRREERVAAYRDHVEKALSALPRKIITPDVVAQLVEKGCDCHGVAADEAEKCVREAAAGLGVRYVSQQRAVEHLTRLVADKMAGSALLRQSDRQRIFAEGTQWGVAAADVEAIIADQVECNRRAQAARRKAVGIALASAAVAAIILTSVAGGWALLRGTWSRPETAAGPAESGASAPSEPGAPADPAPDDWWDVNLSVAMTRAEIELSPQRAALAQIRSTDSAARGRGYEQLLDGLPETVARRGPASSVLQDVVAGCYALDPANDAAARLRERLVRYVAPAEQPLSADLSPYQQAYAAAQMATAAATHAGAAPDRREAMRRALEGALPLTVDPKWSDSELRRQTLAALTTLLYRRLTSAAASQPRSLLPLYAYVADQAARHLDGGSRERLEAQFLQALLTADPSVWRQYQDALLRVVEAADSAAVLQAVELLERSTEDSLRFFLAAALLRRIGIAPERQSPTEVAALVREKFGLRATGADFLEDGWRRLLGDAQAQLDALGADDAPPQRLLEETVRLARLAAMGCALSQGELGRGAYEQLAAREPLSLEKLAAAGELGASPEPAKDARARLVGRYIDNLSRANQPVQRVGLLRGIVENSDSIREVEPQEAEVIAKYLLAPKSDEERETIAALVPQVGRWKTVRLALADLIAETPVRKELVEEVVARVLAQEVKSEGEEAWRKTLRAWLMRSVLEGGVAAPSVNPLDAAQQALVEIYATQANVLGVSSASAASASSPTAVLPAMIEHVASRVGSAAAGSDRDLLARLPHELVVAEYLGDQDLRRLALLERLWLQVLAIETAQVRADRAHQARSLVEGLAQQDRRSSDVLTQLRDGHAALLRLWMLRAPGPT